MSKKDEKQKKQETTPDEALKVAQAMLPHFQSLKDEAQQLKALRLLGELAYPNKRLRASVEYC